MTTDKKARKEMPIARGVLGYFPDAVAEVAHVSLVGNRQHNGPDAPMHWAREKSTDHADCIVRHLIEAGTIDDDGLRHSAKVAWRALALLQTEIEDDSEQAAMSGCTGGPRTKRKVYLAGPMRGYAGFNFAAFDAARDKLDALGYDVISPADLDRRAGVKLPENPNTPITDTSPFVKRDVEALLSLGRDGMLVLLPGWEDSMGATAERAVARWLQLEIRELSGF